MDTVNWILDNGVAGVGFFVTVYIYANGSMFSRKLEKQLMQKIADVSDDNKENRSDIKVLDEKLENLEKQLTEIRVVQKSNADKLDELKTLLIQANL